jgi:hypothetical protein
MRETILRWGCAAILLAIVESCAVAFELTKDDVDFRKEVYVNKRGDKSPYRLFVPIGYSSANMWIQRSTVEVAAFVLAAKCPVGENWSDPELNQPTNALQLALEILASVEKQWPHLCCGPTDGWIGCVVAAAAGCPSTGFPCGCFKEMPTGAFPWIWCGK